MQSKSSSIYPLYHARAVEELAPTFTVPAFNLRGLPQLTARAMFQAAQETETGLFIFELARSEMKYTGQTPASFAQNILAAAAEAKWDKPVFIQGDHYQAKAEEPGIAKEGEVDALKKLIEESVAAQIFNIDIDASTLVDLSKSTELEQQKPNFELAAELAKLARELQPEGITISLGGEIGEVGKATSRPAELIAFMDGFNNKFNETLAADSHIDSTRKIGLSKISIQTGTKHGGGLSTDGVIEPMQVEFETIKTLSHLARKTYQLGGVVQHGASTLAKDQFAHFPKAETLEIHLSTGLQNIIFDHPLFPLDLKQEIYHWLELNCSHERKDQESDLQFHYRLRKKSWQVFSPKIESLPSPVLDGIYQNLKNEFLFFFGALNVQHTQTLVNQYIK